MEPEDAVLLLAAAPATAYREYLYRPGGPLARWIDDRFEVLATPGRHAREEVREGDILLEVALGRADGGRCITITAGRVEWEPSAHGLPPGRMLLRRRRRAELTEPRAVEPVAGWPGDAEPPPSTRSADLAPETEHDFADATDGGASPNPDTAAAVPPFTAAERSVVVEPLLTARASADAVAWTTRTHPAVSGVRIDDIRAALSAYVEAAAVRAAIERRNRRRPGDPVDAADGVAVLVECLHQFQVKCYRDRSEHDGRAGESTLDSLGLVVRAGSGFRRADRGNATALERLRSVDQRRLRELTSDEFSAANWFDAMVDPSVLGRRTTHGSGLHLLLVRRLRQAERHLLTLPAYRGMTPAALGAALGLTEAHGGARPSAGASTSVHTFGLAIDIAHRANPWVHDPASWRAMRHAATLVSGTVLSHASAPAYFSALGSSGRSTGDIWDELQRRNSDMITYFRLGEDAPSLSSTLRAAHAGGRPGVLEAQETVEQAAARWHRRIEQDRDSLAATDFRHGPPGAGFLSLPRDLVIALRDHACLVWGAVDFGGGPRGSGDMMHFDARLGGVGQLLASGVNTVPTRGHPCLSAAASSTGADAANDPEPRTVADHLDGRLWTFVPESYGLPVAVFCPRAALSRGDVEVLLFAHGLLRGCPRPAHVPSGFVTDPPFALGRIVHDSGRPLVLVVPLLDWARPGGHDAFGRGHERWHALARPERLNTLIGEVLVEVGRVNGRAAPTITDLVVAGHSRAYDFLEPLADSRRADSMRRGALATLSAVWAFDTTYAGRVAAWVDWLAVDPRLRVEVFYRPGTPTGALGQEFHRRRQDRLAVTPVREEHCDVPATSLRALLGRATRRDVAEDAGPPAAPPTAEELTNRIVRCIGIWETNRGLDDPAPRESALDTVAGVHASMATTEQATMPYAITVLRRHKSLRDRARPPLTLKELNAADARAAAVATLLDAVATASSHGAAPDDFIAGHGPAIAATGLVDDDVRTMFRAETLKGVLRQARADMDAAERLTTAGHGTAAGRAAAVRAARERSLAASLAAVPDRLGLGESSLRAYVRTPANWGEHRAGWQRRAVQAMPGDVGPRIEAVAVSDDGTALAVPATRARVDAEKAKRPAPSTEDVVRAVARQNNPHEADYGRHVWQTYQRLYPD